MSEPSLGATGERLVAAWQAAVDRAELAERELKSARSELLNTTNALGRWITPGDTGFGEALSVWWGDRLLTARLVDSGTYHITIRERRLCR